MALDRAPSLLILSMCLSASTRLYHFFDLRMPVSFLSALLLSYFCSSVSSRAAATNKAATSPALTLISQLLLDPFKGPAEPSEVLISDLPDGLSFYPAD